MTRQPEQMLSFGPSSLQRLGDRLEDPARFHELVAVNTSEVSILAWRQLSQVLGLLAVSSPGDQRFGDSKDNGWVE